jgi:hypothetical protein
MNDAFINIPREYTAIAEWLFCLLFILILPKRIKGVKLYLWSALWLALFIVYQYVAGILPLYMWIPGMIGAVLMMWAFIYFTTSINFTTSVYFVIQAFIMAEFAASIEWQIYYFYLHTWGDSLVLKTIILVLVFGVTFLVLYLLEARYKKVIQKIIITRNDIYVTFITGLLVFVISNLSFTGIQSPFTGRYVIEIFYIRSLVDFVGIILFYAQREHKRFTLSQMELLVTNNILEKHYQQYTISQESIKIINQKYHDMKHQINLIKNEMDLEKRDEYIQKLEEGIKVYETQFKTGYDVLDTILQSKGFQCTEHHIRLNVVAEGELLKFMNIMDLVSVFGNMLDNAIESCKQIDEIDKRLIHIVVFRQKNMVIIRCENYFENVLKYDNGMLATTKKDTINHGYGIRSITDIINQYEGTVRITTDHNWFKIICLMPIAQEVK